MERVCVYDAAVLGAGVGGAALAAALAARGWHVLAVDRDEFPRHKVCGEFLSPETLDMLKTVGVELPTGASAAPVRLTMARLYAVTGAPLEVPFQGTALGWSRYALDSALHAAARKAGAEVITGTTVTSVAPTEQGNGWLIKLKRPGENEETKAEARVVIAAWGRNQRNGLPGRANSRLRSDAAHVGVKLHIEGLGLRDPAVDMYFARDSYIGAAPVEGGRVNVAGLLRLDAFRKAGGTVPSAIGWLADSHPHLRRLLSVGKVVPVSMVAVAPVPASRMPLVWDGLPRIGDAAALIPPLCGDGMAMALRSALVCAELADESLRGRLTPAAWEHRYRASLQRELAAPIRWGRLLHAGLRHPPLARMLLALGRLAPALPQRLLRATRLR